MSKKKRVTPAELSQLRAALAHTYPNCFVPAGATKRPLKIGIFKDLSEDARRVFPGLSLRHIRGFLADYCARVDYHECIRKGAVRVDLQGSFTGFVNADEAEFARTQIKRIKAKKPPLRRRRGPAVQGIGAVTETLVEKLKRLEYWHQSSQMSDDSYALSGKMAKNAAEIEAIRDQIKSGASA